MAWNLILLFDSLPSIPVGHSTIQFKESITVLIDCQIVAFVDSVKAVDGMAPESSAEAKLLQSKRQDPF